LQRRNLSDINDILDAVLDDDSECDQLSDGEVDDGWDDYDPDIDAVAASDDDIPDDTPDDRDQSDSDQSDLDDEPLSSVANPNRLNTNNQLTARANEMYEFESRRQFVAPTVPDFTPEPVTPDPSEKTPYEYFKSFVTDEMIELVATESNKYGIVKKGQNFQFTAKEIETYLGLYLYMGLVKMPAVSCYWQNDLRYFPIADSMSRNRFYSIQSTIHFVDNNLATEDEKTADRIWKLRPWIESIRKNFVAVSNDNENQSVDEIMVAFKGRSICKQYMPNKPKKWGFKLWGRCSASGFLHDFAVYQGKGTGIGIDDLPHCGLGGNVVLQLCQSLPPNIPYKVFADNYFSNFEMAAELARRGLQYTGTIQSNRVHKAPLKSEKDLKEIGRGAISTVYEKTRNLSLVCWLDNKVVRLISTFAGKDPVEQVQRYDKSSKTHVQVNRPHIIKLYNQSMGGVDLLDMMSSLYKRQLKSKRWYLYIFYHTVTLAVVNSWFLYRRDCMLLGIKKTIPMKVFQATLAQALVKKGKPCRGRPSLAELKSPPAKQRRVATPTPDIRYDCVDHWPIHDAKRNRCKLCTKGFSQWKCHKCEVYLCLFPQRNCYVTYHKK